MKTCHICSRQTEAQNVFCPSCGTRLDEQQPHHPHEQIAVSAQQSQSVSSQSVSPQPVPLEPKLKPKPISKRPFRTMVSNLSGSLLRIAKSKGFVISVVCLAVVVFGGWTGYQVFLHNNPKIDYLLVEYKTMKKNEEKPTDLYDNELQYLNELRTNAASSFAVNIRSKYDMNTVLDTEWIDFANALDLLEQISLSLQGGWDQDENWSEFQVQLLEGRRPFADVTFQKDNEHFYLASDTLMDNPLYWTNDDLIEAFIDNDAESLKKQSFQWNEEEKTILREWMRNFILNELTNSAFEVEKKVQYHSPDGSVPLKKITLTLDGYMLRNMFVHIVDDVRTNDELLNMIVRRAELIDAFTKLGALQRAQPVYWDGYEDEDEAGTFNREQFVEQLHVFLYRLRTYFLNEFSGELHMETYVNKDNVIVDRHVQFTVFGEEMQWQIDWMLSTWKDQQAVRHTNKELNLNVRDGGRLTMIKFYQDQTFQKEANTGNFDGEIGFSVREDRTHVINISADYSIQEMIGSKGTSQYDLLLSVMSEGERIRFDIQAEREKNMRNENYDQTIDVQADLTVPVILGRPMTFSIDSTIDIELEKGKPPVKSNLGRRAIRWVDLHEEEKEQFGYELNERLATQFGSVFLDFLVR